MRTRAERRKNDYKKAVRKKNICDKVYGFSYYKNMHQYSKNKIHCSCPMCSCKINNKGRWGASNNYSHADKIKIDSMDNQLKEI